MYSHCQKRFPHIAVLIHEFRPKVVVEQEICTRDDGLVHAISWRYSSSGEYICTKFFYANVSCKSFDDFSMLKFKVFCHMSHVTVGKVTYSECLGFGARIALRRGMR
jgi:hypothetical protein